MGALLTSEPIEMDNTGAIYMALYKAHVTDYRGTARKCGWEIQE